MNNSRTNAFDTVVSLDEQKVDQNLEVIMSKEMVLEDKREELLYFRERANDYNKKACLVGFIGIVVFIFLSMSNLLGIDIMSLMKVMSIMVGIAMGLLLIMALFFTFLFTKGYVNLKNATGVVISGSLLFCVSPFLSVLILAAIPMWNRFITKKLNQLFVEGGLEPVLVNEDPI